MEIKFDDLTDPRVIRFLDDHISDMKSVSPPESKHALDIAGLRKPDITFWSLWQDGELLGCGALKELDSSHGEIKSMRACKLKRRGGIGSYILKHIVAEAKSRGYGQLSLETGSMPFFCACSPAIP